MTRLGRFRTFAELVRFEHTIFNLPFAYLGAVLAAGGWPSWHALFWITVAMAGARTASMAMNRLFDADIDAKTPRTRNRHIPSGIVAKREVWILIGVALLLLLLSAANLNRLCLLLYPFAVLTVALYSFTKRFTWLCHLWLGLAVAWAPFGAYIAVAGRVTPEILLLVAVITLWNAGFDILYATQDMEPDRANGVYSIPARFGLALALKISRFLHLGVVGLTLLFGFYVGLFTGLNPLVWPSAGWFYLIGWAGVAALLHYEHHIISPTDLSRLNAAFFNVNGYVSIIYFLFTAAAIGVR